MRLSNRARIWVVLPVLVAGVLLSGCREEEQGRTISFEKGVYPGGAPMQALSEETLGELRVRAARTQGFY